jgi:hypothetical protein
MMRQLIGGLAGIGLIVLVGCTGGPTAVEAKGVLTWEDGKPIAGANIRLVPKEKGSTEVIGSTDKDGAFSLNTLAGKPGCPKGEYTVVVTQTEGGGEMPPMAGGQMTQEEMAKLMQAFKDKQKTAPKSEIPAMYGDAAKSPLTLKIDGANSKIELKLKKS